MKQSMSLILLFCFLAVSIQAQSDYHKDRILIKIKEGTKFRIGEKILNNEKFSICGETKVDELNFKYKCKTIKHLFTE